MRSFVEGMRCACQLTWSRFFITARGNVTPYLSCYLYGLSQLSLAIVINVAAAPPPAPCQSLPSFAFHKSLTRCRCVALWGRHNPLWVSPCIRVPKSSSSRRYVRFATIIVDVNHKKESRRGAAAEEKNKSRQKYTNIFQSQSTVTERGELFTQIASEWAWILM